MTLSQIAIPVVVRPDLIQMENTLGDAIGLCGKIAGHSLDKELSGALGFDKAQFSRWQSGGEGIIWPKFVKFMDFCGNDAPLLWMLNARGYDLHSIRKRQTELEKRVSALEEENAKLRNEREVELRLFSKLRTA